MKTVVVREYSDGFGWGYKKGTKTVDVVHCCILARYLNAGVTDMNLVLKTKLQEEMKGTSNYGIDKFVQAITALDNYEGNDKALKMIRRLAKKLKMKVIVKYRPTFDAGVGY